MIKNEIIGYHGTTYSAAKTILEEQQFRYSERTNDWLGTGAYFFLYKSHAERWITHKRFRSEKTAILAAKLEYTNDQMLDLDDPQTLEQVNQVIEAAINKVNISNVIGANVDFVHLNKQQKWCFVCNLYRYLNDDIGITKYTFPSVRYGTSGFSENQCQICVSKNDIIADIQEG